MSLDFHPLAEAFPLIEGVQFDMLVKSVKENGLREPITLYEGAVLDGRNRYRACQAAGIEPRTEDFNGGDPVAFVVDMNANRRHLNPSQRAMAAARLTIGSKYPMDNCRAGNGRFRRIEMTIDRAAELLNVARANVVRAKMILKQGSKEDINAIESGAERISGIAKRITPQAVKIDESEKSKRHAGAKIRVPAGQSASQLCRAAMEMEDGGLTAEAAADKLNISIGSYRQMRDIVMLADRTDLGDADEKLAAAALEKLDKDRQPGVAHKMVRGLVDRIWGRVPRRGKAEQKAIEHFTGTVIMVADTCERLADLRVPQISEEDAVEAVKNLRAAEGHLQKVRKKIQELRR